MEAQGDLSHVSVGQTILQIACSSDPSGGPHALWTTAAGSMPELLDYTIKVI